jgi:hypothetical protein
MRHVLHKGGEHARRTVRAVAACARRSSLTADPRGHHVPEASRAARCRVRHLPHCGRVPCCFAVNFRCQACHGRLPQRPCVGCNKNCHTVSVCQQLRWATTKAPPPRDDLGWGAEMSGARPTPSRYRVSRHHRLRVRRARALAQLAAIQLYTGGALVGRFGYRKPYVQRFVARLLLALLLALAPWRGAGTRATWAPRRWSEGVRPARPRGFTN